MLESKESLILYHGSYCEVLSPDLRQCAKRKDFGQGFYLKMVDYLKKALIYGHTSRISS